MTEQTLHQALTDLRDGRSTAAAHALPQWLLQVVPGGIDDPEEVAAQVHTALWLALVDGAIHPDDEDRTSVKRRVEACARVERRRQRHGRRRVDPAGIADPSGDPAQGPAAAAEDDAARLGEVRQRLEVFEAMAARCAETYRVDRRRLARKTWRLWRWQRRSDPARYRPVHELVAKEFPKLPKTTSSRHHPPTWRRHRDRLMRRRTRLRHRLESHIDDEHQQGRLVREDRATFLHAVLPWYGNHPVNWSKLHEEAA